MYTVVKLDIEPYTIQTMFKSANIHHCWEFIKNQKKKHIQQLYVTNRIGEFVDPPEDVKSLINYYKVIA